MINKTRNTLFKKMKNSGNQQKKYSPRMYLGFNKASIHLTLFFPHRGHLYYRDVGHDGLLEEEQLCWWSLLWWDYLLLQLCWEGSGMYIYRNVLLNQDYFGVIFTVNFVGIMFFNQKQITEMLSVKGIYKSLNHMHSQVITSYLRYCAMKFVNLLI